MTLDLPPSYLCRPTPGAPPGRRPDPIRPRLLPAVPTCTQHHGHRPWSLLLEKGQTERPMVVTILGVIALGSFILPSGISRKLTFTCSCSSVGRLPLVPCRRPRRCPPSPAPTPSPLSPRRGEPPPREQAQAQTQGCGAGAGQQQSNPSKAPGILSYGSRPQLPSNLGGQSHPHSPPVITSRRPPAPPAPPPPLLGQP